MMYGGHGGLDGHEWSSSPLYPSGMNPWSHWVLDPVCMKQ
jgi:hypothetical protein